MVLISSFLWTKTRQNNRIDTCQIFSLGELDEEEEIFSFTEKVEETEAEGCEVVVGCLCSDPGNSVLRSPGFLRYCHKAVVESCYTPVVAKQNREKLH